MPTPARTKLAGIFINSPVGPTNSTVTFGNPPRCHRRYSLRETTNSARIASCPPASSVNEGATNCSPNPVDTYTLAPANRFGDGFTSRSANVACTLSGPSVMFDSANFPAMGAPTCPDSANPKKYKHSSFDMAPVYPVSSTHIHITQAC